MLWRRVFDPDNGLLNALLLQLHIISQPHVWLASGRGAIVWITLVHVWGVLPLVSLIFLAGLQSIPDEVYSASAVDGAGPLRQFRHITLPLLRPSMAIALTVGTLLAIAIFDEIYVLNGTALNTRSILIQVYNTTFAQADFAHGTALAFLLAAADGGARRALRAGPAEVDGMTSVGWRIAKVLAILAIVAWSIAPILIGVSTSISTQREVNDVPTKWVPHSPTLQAYHDLLGGTSSQRGRRHGDRGRHVHPLDLQQRRAVGRLHRVHPDLRDDGRLRVRPAALPVRRRGAGDPGGDDDRADLRDRDLAVQGAGRPPA